MSPTKLLIRTGLAVMCLTLMHSVAKAEDSDQLTSECETLLAQQWKALSKEDYATANKMLDRARAKGCLRQPVAGRLCDVPADQEAVHAANGNATLVNIARNQQRLLGCQM